MRRTRSSSPGRTGRWRARSPAAGPGLASRVRDVESSDVTEQKLAGQTGAVDRTGRERDARGEGRIEGGRRGGRRSTANGSGARVSSIGWSRKRRRAHREDVHRARHREARCRRHARVVAIRGRDAAPARPAVRQFQLQARSRHRPDGDDLRECCATRNSRVSPCRASNSTGMAATSPTSGAARGRLGVSAEAVSGQLATYFGVESGVLVRQVDERLRRGEGRSEGGRCHHGGERQAGQGRRRAAPRDRRRDARATRREGITLSVTRDKKPITLKATIEDPSPSASARAPRRVGPPPLTPALSPRAGRGS